MTDDRIAALESELAKAQAEADRWRSDYRELQALHSSVAARVIGSDYELTQAKAELLKFKLWMENVPTDSQLDAKVPSLDGETGRELLRSLGA